MKQLEDWLIPVAIVGFFLFGALAGGKAVSIVKEAEILRLKLTHAEEVAKAADGALERFRKALQRGDLLQTRLAQLEKDQQDQALEHAREIKRLTTGRPCLNAGTVRLLNQPGPGVQPGPVPAAASEPPAADGGSAADSDLEPGAEVATDTDVAGWIDHAKRRYAVCRARLQALIDWWHE